MTALIVLTFLVSAVISLVFYIVKNKDIKIKNVELITKTQKELYQTEGKNTLDNQTSTAHNLLKKIWIDIFETGIYNFKNNYKN